MTSLLKRFPLVYLLVDGTMQQKYTRTAKTSTMKKKRYWKQLIDRTQQQQQPQATAIQSSSSETICLLDIAKTCTLKASLMKIACSMCMEYGRGNQASNYNIAAFNWKLRKNSGGNETNRTLTSFIDCTQWDISNYTESENFEVIFLVLIWNFCYFYSEERKFTRGPQQIGVIW